MRIVSICLMVTTMWACSPSPRYDVVIRNGTLLDGSGGAPRVGGVAITRLLADGRSQSDIRQGVTLEVFGEGTSGGPLTGRMKADILA